MPSPNNLPTTDWYMVADELETDASERELERSEWDELRSEWPDNFEMD